jgi:hypothetical protein
MHKITGSLLLIVLLGLGSGCGQIQLQGAPDPFVAVQRLNQQQGNNGAQILGSRQLPNEQVAIFFSQTQLPGPGVLQGSETFGYHVLARESDGLWYTRGSGAMTMAVGSEAAEPVIYVEGSAPGGPNSQDRSFLYGRFLSADVAAVEVSLANGEILREEAAGGDGLFALLSTPGMPFCELCIIGGDDQVLRRDKLNPPANNQGNTTCPN